MLITVDDSASLEAVSARIANVERRAQFTQPERRIVSTNWNGKTLEVLTTSQKLAHRIAREVEKAFAGHAHFSWSDDDGSLLATVEVGRPHAKREIEVNGVGLSENDVECRDSAVSSRRF